MSIGPKTVKEWTKLLKDAKTILWNGPLGVFEFESPLIKQAIKKLESLYETTTIRHYKSLKILIDKFSDYIRYNEISEGKDGNMSELQRIWKEAGSNIRSYKDLEKQVEEELRTKTRGGHEIGDY